MTKLQILDKGAANFDEKCTGSTHEKPHYRAEYYVSNSGSMKLHLEQNLNAFRRFLEKVSTPLLLVDFGCGPMTAGIAMAEVASEKNPQYKDNTFYFGIDASQNMVDIAQHINAKYKLYSPESFKVIKDTKFDTSQIPQSFDHSGTAILCLSFVLAPGTLQSQDQNENEYTLGQDWKDYVENESRCSETIIVYLNPIDRMFHKNWHLLKSVFQNDDTSVFDYEIPGYNRIRVGWNPIYSSIINGKRK